MEDLLPTTVFGLPLHPLVVHAAVVLVPMAALGLITLVAVPRWRQVYGALLLLTVTAALGASFVAKATGQQLKDSLGAGGPILEKINEHQQWGERVLWAVIPLWFATALFVGLDRRRGGGTAVTVVAVLGVLVAAASLAVVVLAGHSGSTAVWNPTG